MEKRNVVEAKRTPCKAGVSKFCECPDCIAKIHGRPQKQAEDKPGSIADTEAMARIHA